jgi:hypothetical protein
MISRDVLVIFDRIPQVYGRIPIGRVVEFAVYWLAEGAIRLLGETHCCSAAAAEKCEFRQQNSCNMLMNDAIC